MGGWIPGAVVMPFEEENSFDLLKLSGSVPKDLPVLPVVSEWTEAMEVFEELRTQDHDHKALVIDTLSCLEHLCHKHVVERDFQGNWGEKGFRRFMSGYEVALQDWRKMRKALEALRTERGMSIVLLEHIDIRPFKNPAGADYDRYQPICHPKSWYVIKKWADTILFYDWYTEVEKEGSSRAKGKGGTSRVLYSTRYALNPDAKSRLKLPAEIEGGASGEEAWLNLSTEIAKARKEN